MHKKNSYPLARFALALLAALLVTLQAASAHATTVVAISTGFGNHTCALTNGGSVKCWGANEAGQLGNNSFSQSTIPVDVLGLTGPVAAVENGDEFTCALSRAGGVKCWGSNGNGQLGNAAYPNGSPTPVDVDGLTGGIVAVSVGEAHACAITAAGGVKCWGFNGDGQLGNGTTVDSDTPVDVVGLASGVKAVAAGYGHTCALTKTGGVKCWGFNGFGQFGNGTTLDSTTPVAAGLSAGVAAIAAGSYHSCGLATGGAVLRCWGLNQNGQLGSGTTAQFEVVPVEVTRLGEHVLSVAAGALHTCALADDSDKCWGSNDHGQLGDGTTADRFSPVTVTGLGEDTKRISAGGSHTCAVTEEGGAKCWGWNFNGQLGNDTTTDSVKPVPVFGLGGDD